MLKPRLLNCSMVALGFVLACGARGNNHGLVDETSTTESDNTGGKQSTSKGLNIPLGSGGEATGATRASSSHTDITGTGGTTGSSEGQGGVDSTDPSNPGGNGGSTDGIDTEDPPTTSIDTEDPPPEKPGDTEDPPVGDTGDPPVGDTGDPPPGDTGDPPPGETGDPPEGCIMTEIDKVNVIIFGDASPSGADVEGRMWVGGNADFSGYGIASSNDPDAAPQDCADGEFSLVVGGDLSGQVNAGDGKIAVYGANNADNVTACDVTTEKPVDFAAVEKKLKGYSLAFRDYATNGTAGVEFGALVLYGKDPDLNVFSITAEQLSGIGQIKISVPETSSVIVNVSGKDVQWGGMGFVMPDGGQACRGASSDWCHRIVWNLFEAETLDLSGIGVQGSVMAPLATVSGAGGNVDGQLVAQELLGQIEYHPYFFSGCLLLPKS